MSAPTKMSWASRAASAPQPAAPRPCDGPAAALTPVRLADLARPAADAAAAAAPTPTAAPKYVPPSQRKAEEAAKPKELGAADFQSADLFPALGVVPKTVTGASWAQLRAKFAAPAPAAAAPDLSGNAFAALDMDAEETPKPAAPLNFKSMMEDRLKKDEEETRAAEAKEAAEREIEDNDDPHEMTPQQRARLGWTTLPFPRGEEQKMVARRRFAEMDWTDAPLDPEMAYYESGEGFTWEDIRKTLELLRTSESSHQILGAFCRADAVGPDPWQQQETPEEAAARAFQESLTRPKKLSKSMEHLLSIAAAKAARRAAHGPGEAELRAMGQDVGPVGSADALQASMLRA